MSTTPDKSPNKAGLPDGRHTDIDLSGWWRLMPRGCHPYILVARLDRPIGWWLLLLPGWWVIPVAAPDIGAGLPDGAVPCRRRSDARRRLRGQ